MNIVPRLSFVSSHQMSKLLSKIFLDALTLFDVLTLINNILYDLVLNDRSY